jgi:signal transduction histidine kinase
MRQIFFPALLLIYFVLKTGFTVTAVQLYMNPIGFMTGKMLFLLNWNPAEQKPSILKSKMVNFSIHIRFLTYTAMINSIILLILKHVNYGRVPVRVNLDRNYFRQIPENLISNAIKFSPKNKNVHIST